MDDDEARKVKKKRGDGRLNRLLDGLSGSWNVTAMPLRIAIVLVVLGMLITVSIALFGSGPQTQSVDGATITESGLASGSHNGKNGTGTPDRKGDGEPQNPFSGTENTGGGSEGTGVGSEGAASGSENSGAGSWNVDSESGHTPSRSPDSASGDENGTNAPTPAEGSPKASGVTPTPDEDTKNAGIRKLVALTYDDGPSDSTPHILDTLEQYGVKATFFVVGKDQVEYHQEYLERAFADGMEIGSHTYDHRILSRSTPEEIRETMRKNDELLQGVLGVVPAIMRPTGGGINDTVRTTVDKPMILWNIDTLDWKTKDKGYVVQNIKDNVRPGSIVLMHDLVETTGDATFEATAEIVPWLLGEGYEIVTVSEMAKAYGYTLDPGGQYYSFNPLWSPNEEIAQRYQKAWGAEGQ